MIEYEKHYVAFIDVLGFKQLLKNHSCEEIHSIFDSLRENTKISLNLNGKYIKAFEKINYRILSDSIILFINADIEDSFASLLYVCHKLQVELANRDNPILLRGGIAKGDLYVKDDIIYGDGLVKAYLLENNCAKVPRIIFSAQTLDEGRDNTNWMFAELEGLDKLHKEDNDYFYFIDYLNTFNTSVKNTFDYFNNLMLLTKKELSSDTSYPWREKYIWLKDKIENKIKNEVSLKRKFDSIQSEEDIKKTETYNKKLNMYPVDLQMKLEVSCEKN